MSSSLSKREERQLERASRLLEDAAAAEPSADLADELSEAVPPALGAAGHPYTHRPFSDRELRDGLLAWRLPWDQQVRAAAAMRARLRCVACRHRAPRFGGGDDVRTRRPQ